MHTDTPDPERQSGGWIVFGMGLLLVLCAAGWSLYWIQRGVPSRKPSAAFPVEVANALEQVTGLGNPFRVWRSNFDQAKGIEEKNRDRERRNAIAALDEKIKQWKSEGGDGLESSNELETILRAFESPPDRAPDDAAERIEKAFSQLKTAMARNQLWAYLDSNVTNLQSLRESFGTLTPASEPLVHPDPIRDDNNDFALEIGPNGVKMEMVSIPAPPQAIKPPYEFWVGKYEVTREQYKAIVQLPQYVPPPDYPVTYDTSGGTLPMDTIRWIDAYQACLALTGANQAQISQLIPIPRANELYEYRLPTVDEWRYYVSDAKLEPGTQVRDVRSGSPNSFGLCYLMGNVSEWGWGEYDESLIPSESRNLLGITTSMPESSRNLFGASFKITSTHVLSNPMIHTRDIPFRKVAYQASTYGFRVVLAPREDL